MFGSEAFSPKKFEQYFDVFHDYKIDMLLLLFDSFNVWYIYSLLQIFILPQNRLNSELNKPAKLVFKVLTLTTVSWKGSHLTITRIKKEYSFDISLWTVSLKACLNRFKLTM